MKKAQLAKTLEMTINNAETYREILMILVTILYETGRIKDYDINGHAISYFSDDDQEFFIWRIGNGPSYTAIDYLLEYLMLIPKMTITYEISEYLVQISTGGMIARDRYMQMARYKAICKFLLT